MKRSLANFRQEFLALALEFLWKQWSAAGVAGHGRGGGGRVIDPEALLLFTTVWGRYEPRLFDEVLDWLSINSGLINLQRLNNLHEKFQFGDFQVMAAIASRIGDKAALRKWKRVADQVSKYAGHHPEPLFLREDGTDLPTFGSLDESFSPFGLLRGTYSRSGKSQRPDPALPENFLFQLRAFFGMNARSEAVLYLLTQGEGHLRAIARQTGYFPKTIDNVLNEMTLSGVVFYRHQGREKTFWIEKADWEFLVKGRPLSWTPWGLYLSALTAVWKRVDRLEKQSGSPTYQATELREVMGTISEHTSEIPSSHWLVEPPGLMGPEYTEALLERVLLGFRGLLKGIDERSP